jgi:hypothetical protein
LKRLARYVSIALASLAVSAVHAANTDPFDFDYEIEGSNLDRPALVFNDGSKTYIQPRAGQIIALAGGHNEGPYIVVDGTPTTIRFSIAGHSVVATWARSNVFIGGPGAVPGVADDQPSGFAGFSGHLSLVGSRGPLEPVSALDGTLPIASLVKALVPQGWSGSAQKDIDLTATARFETRPGENWTQALDRLMAQTKLYADVDFDTRHVRLHRDVEKSGALDIATGPVASAKEQGTTDQTRPVAAPQESLLAKYFGANAIRDGDDTHTQIRFAAEPKDLKFVSVAGGSLHPKWNADTGVMTIDRAERFAVSDQAHRVEIVRNSGAAYDFPADNAAHLESVFDEKGQTFFKFAPTVINVSVADVHHLGSGEQKGRFYRFDGTAEQFIVTADGQTVNVQRRHDVKYIEQPGAAS